MIKSLEQKLIVFLLLPVAVLLFGTGFLGFIYARGILLSEWREGAILKLERAAHHIEMRLTQPMQWIRMFHGTAEGSGGSMAQEWLIDQLVRMEGVAKVDLQWSQDSAQSQRAEGPGGGRGQGRGRMMRFHRAAISEITPPRLDAESGRKTVDLISELKNESGETIGILRVSLGFDYLMQDILELGWSQGDQACLVDESGNYLAHTFDVGHRARLAETGDEIEASILRAMKEKPFGTVLGPGMPPQMVGGFYKISQAPWTIVIFAPGEKILRPIISFRLYYFVAGMVCILLILVLTHHMGSRIVQPVRELSSEAEKIAAGKYGMPLQPRSSDEMGHLIRSFNKMVEGLRERDFISNTFGRYVDHEVAKEILQNPDFGRLGGEKRQVSILMSDIRGFTPLSDSLKPEGTIKVLNHYFTRMVEAVHRHKGIIVDFFGDGILVFFDPLGGPLIPSLREAVKCAMDMQSAMKEFNEEMRKEGLPEFQMGIGVNAGEVVVGNIGSEYRAKYGIVGSPVNITERIQSLAGGGEVVVPENVLSFLESEVTVGRSFTSKLRGVQEEVRLFVLEGITV
ncbi:MAG: adenylate/guanylate cyclase domain-containing protein [Desulfobacteraceae bacterium]|nr:MAG: adenylate/guanylate cyclase domain-containing protein [Desulfobacteraceae bacterium]